MIRDAIKGVTDKIFSQKGAGDTPASADVTLAGVVTELTEIKELNTTS